MSFAIMPKSRGCKSAFSATAVEGNNKSPLEGLCPLMNCRHEHCWQTSYLGDLNVSGTASESFP